MSAPASEDILNEHESQFHYAVQSITQAAGFTNVYLPGDQNDITDDGLLIKFSCMGATGEQTEKPDHSIEYHRFTGTLETTYVLRRDLNVASALVGVQNKMGEARGKLRTLFSKSHHSFTLGALPWLAVTDIIRGPSAYGTDQKDDRQFDVSKDSFVITYEVRTEAWPT